MRPAPVLKESTERDFSLVASWNEAGSARRAEGLAGVWVEGGSEAAERDC